jgi:hypothetical protein
MGSGGSKLKGEAVPDITSHSPKTESSPPKHTDGPEMHNEYGNKTFDSTYAHDLSQGASAPQPSKTPSSQAQPTDNNKPKPRKQSLKQMWKERKGVPEPKDENGRGIYSGKTTEELVKQARSQVVDGRIAAATAMGSVS